MTQLRVIILTISALLLPSQYASGDVTVLDDGSEKDSFGIAKILIHSEIKVGDSSAFAQAADRLGNVLSRRDPGHVHQIQILLDSPGGDVMEAIRDRPDCTPTSHADRR
jgi:hypothetical protein